MGQGLSRRGLLGGGFLQAARARLDREAPAPAVEPDDPGREAARAFWEAGNYRPLAERRAPAVEALVEALAPEPGARVLDLGAGDGDLAIAAAKRGALVDALDLAPARVAQGWDRCRAAGADVAWHEGTMERLPFAAGSFDAVVSAFGTPYADLQATGRELSRVLGPGGRVVLATWDSAGAMGTVLRLARRADPARFGRTPPERWGTYDGLRLALDRFEDFDMQARELRWSYTDRDALWEALTAPPGPLAGHGDRASAERALAPWVSEDGGGVVLVAAWWLVTA